MMNKLIDIVKEANKIVLDVYNQDNFESSIKSDNSPLTEADIKASDYICAQLKNNFPEIPIICEETKQVEYEERKDWDKFWLVDPLDGTKEFIKRNGEFTVNIGLIDGGEPTIGVVGIPCRDQIYYGEKGKGSFSLDLKTGQTKDLHCQPFTPTDELTIIQSRSYCNQETEDYHQRYNIKDTISSGSSIKFLLLCENQAQIYPRFHPCMEWDTAASDAILREAGGSIRLTDEKSFLQYNKHSLLNPSFIAFGNLRDGN